MKTIVAYLADEHKYFGVFIAVLCLYALLGVLLAGVCVTYFPHALSIALSAVLLGSALLAFAMRQLHHWAFKRWMHNVLEG